MRVAMLRLYDRVMSTVNRHHRPVYVPEPRQVIMPGPTLAPGRRGWPVRSRWRVSRDDGTPSLA